MNGLREQISVLGYTAGWSAVRHLPERAAYATFRAIADAAWWKRGPSVRRLEANLARALGSSDPDLIRETSRAGMRSYLRYWCEAFRLPDWNRERIMTRVQVEGEDYLRGLLSDGRGAIAALPHMANWDHAGAWASLAVPPVTTVAERLKPEALFERFVAFREGLGMNILPLTGGSEDVFAGLAARLRGPHLVPLLADRDLGRRGIEVKLLGEATRMPAGPASLAVRTGAALLPTTLWYEGDEPDHRLVIWFHEEIAAPSEVKGAQRVVHMTQALADEFSEGIAAHPHDWHMMQRLFLADLSDNDSR